MKESIYRTPRTYGSPAGYDTELSHCSDRIGRTAENFLGDMLRGGRLEAPENMADYAVKLAEAFAAALEKSGHMLEVQDAPGMKKDYGGERGSA